MDKLKHKLGFVRGMTFHNCPLSVNNRREQGRGAQAQASLKEAKDEVRQEVKSVFKSVVPDKSTTLQ